MIVTYNWLKEIINTDLSPKEVSEILTATGLEVEEFEKVESIKGGLAGIVVGKVITCEKHPDADKLSVTTVNIGTEVSQIVCGAPNVAAGQTVLVATIGTQLYAADGSQFTIKKTKIRGVESHGMICAEDEIGLGTSHDGILVIEDTWEAGTTAASIYRPDTDYTYSLNITPNRNDALSVIGVARDIYAYQLCHGRKATWLPQAVQPTTGHDTFPMSVQIQNTEACKRYAGIVMSNVRVTSSPAWLRDKLIKVDIKPINNIVDTTNYIMWLYGQPLHAFDYDKIKNHTVQIKTQLWDQPFLALDHTEKKIAESDLMICDSEQPMCIAGVYGGADSGISDNTQNIFIESAAFDGKYIRRTAQRLNLRTDASQRFEKGTDPNIVVEALWQAVHLLKQIQPEIEIASELIDQYPVKIEPARVWVRFKRIEEIIGVAISEEKVITILNALDIKIEAKNAENFIAIIPTNKTDVTREIDVIEEILRIYGLDAITLPTRVKSVLSLQARPDEEKIYRRTAENLVGQGFREIVTNSLCRSKDASLFYDEKIFIKLLASINKELDILRPDMVLNAMPVIAHNINNGISDLLLFEKGKSYFINKDRKIEKTQFVLFASGQMYTDSHHQKSIAADNFLLKSEVRNILSSITNSKIVESTVEDHPLIEGITVFTINKNVVGHVGQIKQAITKNFDIKRSCYAAIVEWELVLSMYQNQAVTYKEIVKYPIVRRDLSMYMNSDMTYLLIQQHVKNLQIPILKEMNIFDVYQDTKTKEGKKSYSMSFYFQDATRTLTDADIDNAMNKITTSLEEKLLLELRK